GAGLDAEPDAPCPGTPHVSGRELHRFLAARRARCVERFEVAAIALVKLDDRLELLVVIAKIGPHARCSRVRAGDSAEAPEIAIEPACALHSARLRLRNLQNWAAAPREEDVAVPVGPAEAALVRVDRCEAVADRVQVHRFLEPPPVVRYRFTALMIADAQVIERRGVHGIPVTVVERAIAVAVPGKIGMAAEIAADDAKGAAARFHAMIAHARHVLRLAGMRG